MAHWSSGRKLEPMQLIARERGEDTASDLLAEDRE
jgi:hypothetical protein